MTDPSPVRFGTFELDLRTGELRKHGIRLKLQDQPFQVLRTLIQRPGELITREELQRAVWGDSTFVDFDQSLNRAINKVREALSDTADNPRYIETIARRGYRFIAPVEDLRKPVEAAPPQAAPARPPWIWIAATTVTILFTVAAGLWLIRFRTPQPQPRLLPLTTYAGFEVLPAFSPGGQHVSFSWDGESQDNMDLYVKLLGSVTPLRLTRDPAYDGLPAWSPDGRQIAFFSTRDGGGIYLVSPDGGPQRKLADLSTQSRPAWTADGKSLLVATQHRERLQKGDGALLIVPVEGAAAPRQILAPPDGFWFTHPAFAPDGRTLAFASCTGALRGQSCSLQLVALRSGSAAAGSPRQIAKTAFRISGIAWTSDGSSLVYSGGSSITNSCLYRVNVMDGRPAEKLELAGANTAAPAIDGSSRRLAFMKDLSSSQLYRLQVGRKPEPFLPSSSTTDSGPQFSPDGSRIAFNSDRHVASMAVWTANSDGTGAARIANIASSHSGTPRWSPDGRWLAFDALREGGGWDIWVMAASGSSPRQLTHASGTCVIPSWSRDGKSIYFASNRSGRFEVWRSPSGGGTAVQVTRNGGYTAFESTDGKTLYYTVSEGGNEGLYAKLLPDGDEKQIVKQPVPLRAFAVFDDGVFYLHPRPGKPWEIRFHPFGGQTRTIAEFDARPLLGLTVSPDRKTFVFTNSTNQGSDLMLIENFR